MTTPSPQFSLPAAEKQRILEERAALLAAIPVQTAIGEQRTLVTFELGGEMYATDVEHVLEVRPLTGCVPVPCTPSHIAGLVNQRGRLLTVIDVRALLGLPGGDTPHPQMLAVVVGDGQTVGVRVDRVGGAVTVLRRDILMASELLLTLPPEIQAGMITLNEQLTVVLDLSRLLGGTTWLVDDRVR